MANRPGSSDAQAPQGGGPASGPDEAVLSLLVALHHRGTLAPTELSQLVGQKVIDPPVLARLVQSGFVQARGGDLAITHQGRQQLDRWLEEVESQVAPDDPAYVRRYRREDPSLPAAANTVWAEAVCVNVRVDPAALRPLVPDVFELDLFAGCAWISLTASRLKDFGVGWVPKALRMNFYQSTYRAHMKYTDFRGREMRGCYFVRSETNSRLMSTVANLLPEFKAHRCSTYPILMARRGEHWLLTVDSGDDPGGKVVLLLDTSRDLLSPPLEGGGGGTGGFLRRPLLSPFRNPNVFLPPFRRGGRGGFRQPPTVACRPPPSSKRSTKPAL
ncbi:MAG: DUF2071 domain-containing protein [Planctomycetia bacterium]|nr:DUF2071 domain-containing protein [Planctomycetia bacterium]